MLLGSRIFHARNAIKQTLADLPLNGSIVRSALDESENLEFAIQYESLRGVSYQTVVSIRREGLTEDPNGPCSDFTWVITRVQMNRIPLVR